MLEMNLNKIISENDLPQGSIIIFRYTFGEMDIEELAKIAEYISDFLKRKILILYLFQIQQKQK